MATIGLDKIYYATITDGSTGETWGTPTALAGAIKADLKAEFAEGELYADNALSAQAKEFTKATLTLNVEDINNVSMAALLGSTQDTKKVLVDRDDDIAPYVAVGFRAKKSNGAYRYVWLYRGKFSQPDMSVDTKDNSIKFGTKTIVGTFERRKKIDDGGKYPWRAMVDSDDTGVADGTITNWFSTVYEPDFTA